MSGRLRPAMLERPGGCAAPEMRVELLGPMRRSGVACARRGALRVAGPNARWPISRAGACCRHGGGPKCSREAVTPPGREKCAR